MKKYRAAAILMMIHGGLLEIGGCLALIPVLILGSDSFDMAQYFSFIVPFFQDHMTLMMIIGGLYGIIRLIGAIALWKNKMWGLALSIINCIITLALMIFMLPVGMVDGLLAGSSLILILTAYFGQKPIVAR